MEWGYGSLRPAEVPPKGFLVLLRSVKVSLEKQGNASDQLPFARRRRVQLGGALLFAVFLPWAIRSMIGIEPAYLDLVRNTVVANAVAVLIGFYIYRSIAIYPGTQASYSILPTFLIAYVLVLTVLIFTRLDYNRILLISGFLASVLWFYFLVLMPQHRRPLRIGVVPFGDVGAPVHRRRAEWYTIAKPEAAQVQNYDMLVADFRVDLPDEWERYLADVTLAGVPVLHVKQLRESLTGRVEIDHLSENNFGALIPDHVYLKVKQAVDLATAVIALALLAPLLLIVGAAVRLDSSGPALFRQRRVGYAGRIFTVYKFRTMKVPDGTAADRENAMTSEDDPRITRLGRFLRRSRIDELPQIINILRGEMSWIGPRPEAQVLSQWYESELPFYRYRHIVRPGITGWAQVNQGHVAEVDDVLIKLHYDFYYIRYFSPWLDALITVRTIVTVFTGFGSR